MGMAEMYGEMQYWMYTFLFPLFYLNIYVLLSTAHSAI